MQTTAITAFPFSYYESFKPFRATDRTAIRTGLRGKSFVHFLIPCAMLNSLVRQLMSEGRPTGIQNGFGHVGFCKRGGVDIANRNVIELCDEPRRKLMVKIIPAMRYLCVDRLDAALFMGALRHGQRLFCATIDALRFNFLTSGQRCEVFQTKVNADTTQRQTRANSDGGRARACRASSACADARWR